MNAAFLLFILSNPQGTTLEQIERDVAAIVEKTRPSVVQIAARLGDEEFQSRIAAPKSIQFSGFVVSADGYILTDLGGVEWAKSIQVILHDGRRLAGDIKAIDRPTSVALLRVKADGLKPVEFADAASIRQGAIAVLVSNPAGLGQSCSVGFVTGLGRSIQVSGVRYDDMLQTSAAVLSGDGGGLLANARGLVVGMIHSRYVPDGLDPDPAGFLRPVPREGLDFLPAGGPAVGFATPGTTLKFVADRLMKHGRVQRGWAGLALQRKGETALVVDVIPGGPAWKAGIRRGDAVVEFDGQSAKDLPAIRRQVVETVAPKTVKVRVLRQAAPQDLDVTIDWEPVP